MKTLQEWVILANNVFNNKYEYLSKYKKDNKYHFLEIKCKIHGIFHKTCLSLVYGFSFIFNH